MKEEVMKQVFIVGNPQQAIVWIKELQNNGNKIVFDFDETKTPFEKIECIQLILSSEAGLASITVYTECQLTELKKELVSLMGKSSGIAQYASMENIHKPVEVFAQLKLKKAVSNAMLIDLTQKNSLERLNAMIAA